MHGPCCCGRLNRASCAAVAAESWMPCIWVQSAKCRACGQAVRRGVQCLLPSLCRRTEVATVRGALLAWPGLWAGPCPSPAGSHVPGCEGPSALARRRWCAWTRRRRCRPRCAAPCATRGCCCAARSCGRRARALPSRSRSKRACARSCPAPCAMKKGAGLATAAAHGACSLGGPARRVAAAGA